MIIVKVSNTQTKKIKLSSIQDDLIEKSLKDIVAEKLKLTPEEVNAKIVGPDVVVTTGEQKIEKINPKDLVDKNIKQILKDRGYKITKNTSIEVSEGK